ncbi:MAG TPA: transcription antitermination factor NusB [Gemmatimonadales bacterium]|jgi:N utilization substance protein B|nr:transcription antitermination factor NusB [Gemmatimonadales bacterium]
MALRSATRARARALQLLYAWEVDGRPDLEAILPRMERLTRSEPAVFRPAAELARGVVARRAELDALFATAAEHWRLDRLALVDRNILRLSVYELLERRVPPKVAIDEALWLAHRFGSRQSPAFVNGVLDQVARTLGQL